MADTLVLEASAERRESSSLSWGTKQQGNIMATKTSNSTYRMSKQTKVLAGLARNSHERGAFLRQMSEAEQTYLRMRQRQPRARDKEE